MQTTLCQPKRNSKNQQGQPFESSIDDIDKNHKYHRQDSSVVECFPRTNKSTVQASAMASCCGGELFTYIYLAAAVHISIKLTFQNRMPWKRLEPQTSLSLKEAREKLD